MSLLLAIRKYLSIDQILIYRIVYDVTVTQRRRMSEAVAKIEGEDDRRNYAAVKKVIDSLNQKFENIFGEALLKRTEGEDYWLATELGTHVYTFAKSVEQQYTHLEATLQLRAPEATRITIALRDSLGHLIAQIKARAIEKKLNVEMPFRNLRNESYKVAFRDLSTSYVCDEFFLSDKHSIDTTEYRYLQLPGEKLLVVTPPGYVDLGKIIADEAGASSLQQSEIPSLNIKVLRKAFSLRAAAEISGADIGGDDIVSPDNIALVQAKFPKIEFFDYSIDDLSFYLDRKAGYAFIMSEREADRLDQAVGLKHDRLRIVKDRLGQYYNPVIVYRANQNVAPLTSEGRDFFGVLRTFKEDVGVHQLAVNPNSIDYAKPSFNCPRCNHRITYTEADGQSLVIRPCSNCLSVVSFEPMLGRQSERTSIVKPHNDVVYTDQIYDPLFVCPSHDCSAQFAPRLMKTAKGRDYVFCDSCNTIFQAEASKQTTVHRKCGASNCDLDHPFRFSKAKPIDEISCYNAMHRVKYDSEKDLVYFGEKITAKVVFADRINTEMKFPCPQFNCKDDRSRRIFRNVDGQTFTRCRSCGTDIQVVLKSEESARRT